ncbi:bestrophin family protein [Aureibacter tunicatorum]|uniref:Membrane protein n=1 Tax=Aureibacter tunicatorum TaxID=866807 RepID=A0AAE3XSA2_9BACT|nr:bestrophin family ion channel [Aureibacter tunicatorum]MDR6240574.1 putative membrane protein [Aureibacter tunicatorum]BDD06565.1 hypothetical protein AUTU_40480 [Aureibacter tunicatorum]
MIVTKGINLGVLVKWSAHHIVWLIAVMGIVAFLYKLGIIQISLPWFPVSVVGTAVAFYVGFKNNQSYDRMWEARKVWGGIVNDSRTWGMVVDGFISNLYTDELVSNSEIQLIKQRLIYRHIAWLYAHRSQLLLPTTWEHVSQRGAMARHAKNSQRKYGIGLYGDEITQTELRHYLTDDEHDRLINQANTAAQIINEQSRDLSKLRERGLIDDFRHLEMTRILRSFYELQGKNERIKKFPFPRQYANMSRYFIGIFILLLPLSIMPEFMKLGDWGLEVAVFISALIAWIYVMMEIIGDYSENPFQGMANDIPMMSLCRSIEIDLRQMLNESDLPPEIKPKGGILM